MSYISAKTQRKLMFIPLVNVLNFFIALHNAGKSPDPRKMRFQICVTVVCCLLPFTFLCSLLMRVFPSAEDIISLCAIYLGPIILSYGCINVQEKELPL